MSSEMNQELKTYEPESDIADKAYDGIGKTIVGDILLFMMVSLMLAKAPKFRARMTNHLSGLRAVAEELDKLINRCLGKGWKQCQLKL